MFKRDILFSTPISSLYDWRFDQKVAEVFSDMIQRSIPSYSNIILMIGILTKRFVQPNTQIYDLGCSLGAVTLSIRRNIHYNNCKIIAVDNSSAMIKYCYRCINAQRALTPVQIIESDIRNISIENASIVVLNFTLQFLCDKDKQALLNKIYQGLNPGGILVISEKFNFEDKIINKILYDAHYDFKRVNGYSELEINQKCNMLKNVMLTDSVKIHKARLQNAGFSHSEIWFQCLNFGSLVALKSNI